MTNGSEHAFPHMSMERGLIKLEGGLSKREYFAGLALSRIAEGDFNKLDPVEAARRSVILADFLLDRLATPDNLPRDDS